MLVFTFPGQGSQRPDMGVPWADHPSFEVVSEASAAASRDIASLLLDSSMEELTLTHNAQLATFVQSLVVLDAVERLGISPGACAGHSLGEYSALVASGAVSFESGVELVLTRADAMARASEDAPGTMAALLGIQDDDAEAACQRAEGDVWVANYNAPGQVVIAGTHEAVRKASSIARELGARRVVDIAVSGAFHTPLMAGARPALRKVLSDTVFGQPDIAVAANVDARVHEAPSEWPGLLSAQLCSPVRWRQSLETLSAAGGTTFVELGHGGVLTGLTKRCLPGIDAISVAQPSDLDHLMEVVAHSDTTLWEPPHVGEHLYMSERIVVAPAAGLFFPESSLAAPGAGLLPGTAPAGTEPSKIAVGDLVGTVGAQEVRTPFAGEVIRWQAASGERVQEGQALLWLRVSTKD